MLVIQSQTFWQHPTMSLWSPCVSSISQDQVASWLMGMKQPSCRAPSCRRAWPHSHPLFSSASLHLSTLKGLVCRAGAGKEM